MANIAHASLTGAELHEPKGITGASLGTVYVSNGSGSGTWANVGTSSLTGMIADFTWPVVQDGWLELDGTDINTTTYSALYNVMTIQRTGTRSSGIPTITSLPSTTNIKVGYYVFGTGISSGTTVLSIDGGTQITMSGNALSTGTSTVIFSPWLLNTNTIRLPNLTTAGRFRRSRSSTTEVGQVQADQNKEHLHTVSGTTNDPGNHTHVNTLTDPGHFHNLSAGAGDFSGSGAIAPREGIAPDGRFTAATKVTGVTINNAAAGAHTHTFSTGTDPSGGTEARPLSLIVMTCVKT